MPHSSAGFNNHTHSPTQPSFLQEKLLKAQKGELSVVQIEILIQMLKNQGRDVPKTVMKELRSLLSIAKKEEKIKATDQQQKVIHSVDVSDAKRHRAAVHQENNDRAFVVDPSLLVSGLRADSAYDALIDPQNRYVAQALKNTFIGKNAQQEAQNYLSRVNNNDMVQYKAVFEDDDFDYTKAEQVFTKQNIDSLQKIPKKQLEKRIEVSNKVVENLSKQYRALKEELDGDAKQGKNGAELQEQLSEVKKAHDAAEIQRTIEQKATLLEQIVQAAQKRNEKRVNYVSDIVGGRKIIESRSIER